MWHKNDRGRFVLAQCVIVPVWRVAVCGPLEEVQATAKANTPAGVRFNPAVMRMLVEGIGKANTLWKKLTLQHIEAFGQFHFVF